MNDDAKRREFALREAKSKIHWGADVAAVLEFLRTDYGIEGDEAEVIISEAVGARSRALRKKAWLSLVFAAIGLAVPVAYFAIQGFVGFVVIGFGPIFMAFIGLASLAMAGRALYRIFTGDSSGPV